MPVATFVEADMKIPVYSLKGEVKRTINLSSAFSEKVRPDLIKRVVVAEESFLRQPYGTDPIAGMRSSAHYHGRRGRRNSMMNREMSRMARIHGSGYLHMRARVVPQAIKGRKAHPPKAEKVFEVKVNKKEKLKAILSAVAATADRDMVSSRGHRIEGLKHLPLVIDDSFQSLKKTSEVEKVMESLGLSDEISRAKEKKVRAGKGKNRGRKYKTKTGPLIIVADDKGISQGARNIPGVDVVDVKNLAVRMLAPGTHPGRLCIWTESAINRIEEMGG